jgi:hypothetical protein
MVQKITWSDDALITFGEAAKYLPDKFSQIELDKFEAKINDKLLVLKSKSTIREKGT